MTNFIRGLARGPSLVCALLLGACSSHPAKVDYDLLFTDIEPIQYARILCRGIELEDQHTCMTSVMEHYERVRMRDIEPEQAVKGPFVVVLRDDLYRGRYVSNPFSAAFTVSNGRNVCRGRYNAFQGDDEPVFRVTCDDGSRGTARTVRDRAGRNGIGIVEMTDGTRGDIVFGYAAVGGAFL